MAFIRNVCDMCCGEEAFWSYMTMNYCDRVQEVRNQHAVLTSSR